MDRARNPNSSNRTIRFGGRCSAIHPREDPLSTAVDPDEPSKEEIKEIEQETDRYRAERAEADLGSSHQEVARLTALLPDAPPAPPPDDKLKRSEARLAETQQMLQTARRESMKWKRRNSGIKRDLVDGKSLMRFS